MSLPSIIFFISYIRYSKSTHIFDIVQITTSPREIKMTSFRTYQTVMEGQASKETKTITSTMTSLGNDWLSRPYSEQTSAKNSWLNYSGTDKLPSTALSIGTPMDDSSSPSMINSTVTSLGNDWLSGPHSRHSSDKIGYFGTDKLYSTASSMGVPIVASSNPSIMCPQPVRPSFGQNLSHGLLPPIYEKPELSFAGGSTPTRFMPPLLRPISEKPELTLDGVSTEATNAFMPPLLRSISEKPELTFDGGSTANTKTPMLPLPRPISVKQELTFDGGSTPSTEAFMPPLPIQLNQSITKKSTKESVRYPFPGMSTALPTGAYVPRQQPNYNSMSPVTCTYPDRGYPGSGMVGFQYRFQHSMTTTGKSTKMHL